MSPPSELSRREFLTRTGKVAGLSLLAGSGVLLHTKERHPFEEDRTGPVVRDLRIQGIARKAIAVRGEDPGEMARVALAEFGGMGTFVAKGDVVIVKPNIGWDRLPEQAANTNPELVAALVRACIAAGAAKVLVTDISCNAPERCFQRSGIALAAREAGAEVEYPSASRYVDVEMGGTVLGRQKVYRPFMEATKLINVPIAKHHGLCGTTLAMKNLYGILGGNRSRLHQDIHESLADLGNFLRPTLTILDAFRVLERNGPQGGNLSDVRMEKTLVASTDPVALDAYAAETWFGLTPDKLPYLALSEAYGLGTPAHRNIPFKHITL